MSLHKQREAERSERGKSACVQLKLPLAAMFGCMYYSASMVLGKRMPEELCSRLCLQTSTWVDTINDHASISSRNSLHMRTRLRVFLEILLKQRLKKTTTFIASTHLSNACKQTSPAPFNAPRSKMDVRLLLRCLLCLVSTAAAFGQTSKNTLVQAHLGNF